MSVDPDLLAILVCPMSRTPLNEDQTSGELIAPASGLAFPVREGVPVLIVEEARRL